MMCESGVGRSHGFWYCAGVFELCMGCGDLYRCCSVQLLYTPMVKYACLLFRNSMIVLAPLASPPCLKKSERNG